MEVKPHRSVEGFFILLNMGKLRSINTVLWSDPFIEDLTVAEKLLFIYLITNEKTNMLGIYESSLKKMSFETGIDIETVRKALKGFETLQKVKYVANHVILVNFMKHQNFNTNMKKSAIDIYMNLPESLKIEGFEPDRRNPSESFETLSKGFGMVRKVEVEVEVEVEYEIEALKSAKIKIFTADVQNCFSEILKSFDAHLQPKTEKQKNEWLKTVDDLNRIDAHPFEVIFEVVKHIRTDSFWAKNFLSLTKLRTKNKEGTQYFIVFAEHLKSTNSKFKKYEPIITETEFYEMRARNSAGG